MKLGDFRKEMNVTAVWAPLTIKGSDGKNKGCDQSQYRKLKDLVKYSTFK